jgi:imidazolonepropionase-like amidohydrolase
VKTLAIVNGTVYPQAGTPLERASVVIRNGKVTAVGPRAVVPRGAEVLDAKGFVVTPGLIDAHTHLGNCGEGTGPMGFDYNEASDAVTPHCRALDGIDPFDLGFDEARRAGVTAACVLPGSANVIGGTGVVIKTVGTVVDDMVVRADAGLKVAFGENTKVTHASKRMPQTRMGNAALLRETLLRAREYVRKRKLPAARRAEFDMKLENVVRVLEGKMPLRAHAHRAHDIATAVRIAREFDCPLVSDHCTEGHLIAPLLKKYNIPCIVGPAIIGRFKLELRYRSYATAGVMERTGLRVALTTDHPFLPIDSLNTAAALAIRDGMSREGAFRAVTQTAAEILGVGRRLGRLVPGCDGDAAIWTDFPLSSAARCVATVVDGVIVYRE